MTLASRIARFLRHPDTGVFAYEIDASDRLIATDHAFLDFARENHGEGLTEEALIGTSIWKWINGDSVADLYRVLYNEIRHTGRKLSFPYRCDAPNRKRYMRMTLTPSATGGIRHVSQLEKEEPLEEIGSAPVSMNLCSCALCRRVNRGDPARTLIKTDADAASAASNSADESEWLEIEVAIASWNLMGRPVDSTLDFVVCPRCQGEVLGDDESPA